MSLRLQGGMHHARLAAPCAMVAIGAALAFTSGARASTVELRWYQGSPGYDVVVNGSTTVASDISGTLSNGGRTMTVSDRAATLTPVGFDPTLPVVPPSCFSSPTDPHTATCLGLAPGRVQETLGSVVPALLPCGGSRCPTPNPTGVIGPIDAFVAYLGSPGGTFAPDPSGEPLFVQDVETARSGPAVSGDVTAKFGPATPNGRDYYAAYTTGHQTITTVGGAPVIIPGPGPAEVFVAPHANEGDIEMSGPANVDMRNGSPELLYCFAGAQVTLRADPTDTIDPSCQGRVTIVP